MKIFGQIPIGDSKNVISVHHDIWNGNDYLHIRKGFWSNEQQKILFTKEGVSIRKEDLANFFIAISKAIDFLKEENKI